MKLSTKIGLIGNAAILASMIAIGVNSAGANSDVRDFVLEDPMENYASIKYNVGALVATPILTNPEVDKIQYAETSKQIYCLAENIYFEARGESVLGQRAVAWVTLNRVNDVNFPDTICDVVWQDGQFSWTHDGKSDKPSNDEAWVNARTIAWQVYHSYDVQFDPTDGATMFHAAYVKPKWRKDYEQTSRIDNHVFYKVEG